MSNSLLNRFLKGAGTVAREESDDIARLAARKAEQEAMESGADLLRQSPSMASMNDDFARQAQREATASAFTDPLSARNSASVFGGPIPEPIPQLPKGNGVGGLEFSRQNAIEDTLKTPSAKNSASVFGNAGMLEPESTVLLPRGNPDLANRRADAFAAFTDPSSAKNSAAVFEANGLGAVESTPILPRGLRTDIPPKVGANVDLPKTTPEVFDKMSFLQKYGKKGAAVAGIGGLAYALSPDSPQMPPPIPPQPAVTQPNAVTPPPVVPTPVDLGGRGSASISQKVMTKGSAPISEKTAMEAILSAQANQFKDTEAGLQEAQDRENRAIFNNQLGKSANLIGASIAGVKPVGQELFDDNIKQAGQITPQYQARMEKANNDPKSGLSVALRQQLKTLGVNAPEAMSATDLMKVVPGAQALHKANEDRAQRAEAARQQSLDRQAMLQVSKDKKSMVDKEQSKEDAKIRTENRKERRQIENDMKSTQTLINELNTTKDMFDKYSKSNILGTGPIATLGGLTPKIMQGSEDLDAQFKKQNLDTMVKMFAGMSKAVDTNAERRAFESAQASMTNDDKTNARLIKEKIDAANSMLQKQKDAVAKYDRYGDFTQDDVSQTNSRQEPVNQQLTTTPDEDAEAVAWAKANSTNPKAKEILRLHGL